MHFSFTEHLLLVFTHNLYMRTLMFRKCLFYRQTFCVYIGQKRNLTPCQSYTRMVNAHWTWYFFTTPYIVKSRSFLSSYHSISNTCLVTIMCTQICKDRDQAECWYLGLTSLVSALYSTVLFFWLIQQEAVG